MAEPEAPAGGAGSIKDKLGKKIGPLPLGVWLVIAAGIFWFVMKSNKEGGGGPQTDGAGNVGTINPNTGYVYGSPEDKAALGSGSSSLGTSGESGTGGATVGGQYVDNSAWAVAAINYLVSIGVDATSANAAITQFLGSQQLSSAQQGMVNLAIQRLGAPPTPPEPGGSPPPVVTPPTSSTFAINPPTGLATSSVNSTAIGLKWNKSTNAVAYTVSWGKSANASDGTMTVSTPAATVTGLSPNTLYHMRVQANPPGPGAGFATLTKTTPKSAGTPFPTTPFPRPTPHPPPAKADIIHQVIRDGESYSAIAAQYHYKPGGVALWKYNYTSAPRPAESKKLIKERGPNKLFHGSTVYVPRS
jgi:hypothetical protein